MLDLCLLAYPRAVRRRDGEHLRELALELASDHGAWREAIGLVVGGLAERRRRQRSWRSLTAVGAAVVVALTALTWTASAHGGEVEEDLLACTTRCADVEAAVEERMRDGWSCTAQREPAGASWRCVRD